VTHFEVGDRVEVIDDIGHHYQSHVGIVTKAQQRVMAVAEEFEVRLADGTVHRFFDLGAALLERSKNPVAAGI